MNEVMKLGTQPEESAEEAESMDPDPNQNTSMLIEIDSDESMEEGDKDEEISEDHAKVIADGKEDSSEKTSVENRHDEHGTPGSVVAN